MAQSLQDAHLMLPKHTKPDPKLPTTPGLAPPCSSVTAPQGQPASLTQQHGPFEHCSYITTFPRTSRQAFLRHPPHSPGLHCPTCLPSPNFRSHCNVLMAFCATEVQPGLLRRMGDISRKRVGTTTNAFLLLSSGLITWTSPLRHLH